MLSSTLFFRRLLLAALPSFALLAGACSDNDGLDPLPSSGGGGANPGAAGRAGAAGASSEGGASGDTGSAGAAGSAGSDAGSAGSDAGSAGSSAEAGAAGSDPGDKLGPGAVDLGTAANYVILAKSAISNVPTSAITGDLGLSPAAASYITGFALTKAGAKWTSPQVTGGVFAADNDPPTVINLTTAIADMQTAYTDAAGRSSPDYSNLGAGSIGGLTLKPGLYKWASSLLIPADIALRGAANDVWILQVTGDLNLSAARAVTLSGGARAKNVFWQVAGTVELGASSHAEGIVLCKTAIKLGTGASINGRLLAQTAINLSSNTVTEPAQ